jgi:hypothetical protein
MLDCTRGVQAGVLRIRPTLTVVEIPDRKSAVSFGRGFASCDPRICNEESLKMTESVDNFLRGLDQEEKVRQFAEALGCSDNQAKVFTRVFADGKVLEWDGVRLMFKHNGEKTIAVDDPTCMAYLKQEYEFLLPAPKSEPVAGFDNVQIDPALVERALNGNQTAKSQIATALASGGKVDSAETVNLFLKAEAQKRGSGGGFNGADAPKSFKGDRRNPFNRLRAGPQGAVDKAVEEEIAEIGRTKGFGEVKRLATEAGKNLSGHDLRRAG